MFAACQGVIFDLNGVLVEDEPLHLAAFQAELAERGLAFSPEDYVRDFFGWTDEDGVLRFNERSGLDLPVKTVVAGKRSRYRALVAARGVAGAEDSVALVRALKEDGRRVALASGAPADEVALWLDALGLQDAFQPAISADTGPEPKPSPAVYAAIADTWRVPPRDCLVIDDYPENVRIARDLGMRTVGVASHLPWGAFVDADLVVRGLRDLTAEPSA